MKKLMALSALFALSASAFANFSNGNVDNSYGAVTTVKQALKAHEDTPVVLTGKITRQVDNDEFYFKDATGEIKIEVDDHAWNGQNITPKDKITIRGKVDKNDYGRSDIDVYSVKKH